MRKVLVILGALLLIFTIVSSAGIGLWSYQLNKDQAGLQLEYDALKAENEGLKQELSQSQADLQAAQTQLKSQQDYLVKAKIDNDSLTLQLKAMRQKAGIVYAFQFSTEAAFDQKVSSSNDVQLKKLWNEVKRTRSDTAYFEVWSYIIQSLADSADI